MQTVTGFAGLSLSYIVGKHDEILRRIEQLTRAEKQAGEVLGEELSSRAAGAMKDEHRVVRMSAGILLRSAKGVVVQL